MAREMAEAHEASASLDVHGVLSNFEKESFFPWR